MDNRSSSERKGITDWTTTTIILASTILIVIILVVLYFLGLGTGQTGIFQDILLAVATTAISSLAAWIIAKRQSDQELRRYGIQAAEKIDIVGNLLKRLADVMSAEVEAKQASGEPTEVKYIKVIEHMRGSVENIRSIQEVNHGSLSDWQGILGKELSQYRLALQSIELVQKQVEKQATEAITTQNEAKLEELFENAAAEIQKIIASSQGHLSKHREKISQMQIS